jgi:hypothetical protein
MACSRTVCAAADFARRSRAEEIGIKVPPARYAVRLPAVGLIAAASWRRQRLSIPLARPAPCQQAMGNVREHENADDPKNDFHGGAPSIHDDAEQGPYRDTPKVQAFVNGESVPGTASAFRSSCFQ